jgi:hypothetical protein
MIIVPAAGVAAVPPKTILPASREDPLVKVILPVLPVFPDPPIVTVPDTVSEGFVPEKVRNAPELVPGPPSKTDAHA